MRDKLSIAIDGNRAVVRPVFTWREHKPPLPRGHRKWLPAKAIEARRAMTTKIGMVGDESAVAQAICPNTGALKENANG